MSFEVSGYAAFTKSLTAGTKDPYGGFMTTASYLRERICKSLRPRAVSSAKMRSLGSSVAGWRPVSRKVLAAASSIAPSSSAFSWRASSSRTPSSSSSWRACWRSQSVTNAAELELAVLSPSGVECELCQPLLARRRIDPVVEHLRNGFAHLDEAAEFAHVLQVVARRP